MGVRRRGVRAAPVGGDPVAPGQRGAHLRHRDWCVVSRGSLTAEQPGPLKGDEVEYDVHVYKTLDEEGEVIQGGMDEDEAEDCPTAATITSLPSAEIEGLWEK